MNCQILPRKHYDDKLEPKFVIDYAEFAAQINFYSIVALREKALGCPDIIQRKCLCLGGLQIYFNSLEDFSILLHAILNKKNGRHLHLTIGVEQDNRQGTTFVPNKLKRFESIQSVFDTLGFNNINVNTILAQTNLSQNELEELFKEVIESIKEIGEYQEQINDSKNLMKHGKALINEDNDSIALLRWKNIQNKEKLCWGHLNVSIRELNRAAKNVAKLYKQSIDLLWLFILNYYPSEEPHFRNVVNEKQTAKYDKFLLNVDK